MSRNQEASEKITFGTAAITGTATDGHPALRTVRPDTQRRVHWVGDVGDEAVFSFWSLDGALQVDVNGATRLSIDAKGGITMHVDRGLFIHGLEEATGEVRTLVADRKTGKLGLQ